MKAKSSFLVLFFVFILSSHLCAQEIGKIFTAAEADSLYGKVMESYTMSSDSLLGLLKETGDKIMFRLKDNKVVIAGNNRQILYPKSAVIKIDDELRVLSTSKVTELIAMGREDKVSIQMREVTLTLQNANFVLEYTYPCPPYCD